MSKCFYLRSVGARGNRAFWSHAKEIENWKHPDSFIFHEANAMAYHCHKSRGRNRVYKRTKRALNDLWWDIFETTGIKLNGIHLGQLYLDAVVTATKNGR